MSHPNTQPTPYHLNITRYEERMPAIDNTASGADLTPAETQEMQKYGIRRIPTDYYVYRAYRYADLASALAQAKLESTMAD